MPRFLVTRAATSLAAIVIALASSELRQLLAAGAVLYAGIVLLGGPKTALRILGATAAMAAPLALVHGIINPAYSASHEILGVLVRVDGLYYAMAISARLALLFGVVGLWLGTPRRTWLALVAATRLPPAWGVAMLQAITLTHVLMLKIARIRQAQRSRGILRDDMGLFERSGAAASVVVPLIAVTLIDASERGALLHRMGLGSYKLRPATPLNAPEPLDLVLSLGIASAALALLAA